MGTRGRLHISLRLRSIDAMAPAFVTGVIAMLLACSTHAVELNQVQRQKLIRAEQAPASPCSADKKAEVEKKSEEDKAKSEEKKEKKALKDEEKKEKKECKDE